MVATKNSSDISSQDIARNAFFVIKSFGEVENNFREVFVDLHLRLKDFLFLNDNDISNKYKLKEGITLRKACKNIDKINSQWIEKHEQKITQLQQ